MASGCSSWKGKYCPDSPPKTGAECVCQEEWWATMVITCGEGGCGEIHAETAPVLWVDEASIFLGCLELPSFRSILMRGLRRVEYVSPPHELNVQIAILFAVAAGLAGGFSGLAAGIAIGIVGDIGTRALGQQPKLFVGMILILIVRWPTPFASP